MNGLNPTSRTTQEGCRVSASDMGNHGRIKALERELAVARQTIRSLQDALAAEHKDEQALQDRIRGFEVDIRDLGEELTQLEAREQELTNALREYGTHKQGCGYRGSGYPESCTCGFAALAPAVEEQR